MSGDKRQITELAKQGMSAQEIAEGLGLPLEVVSSVLVLDAEVVKELDKATKNKLEVEFQSLEDLAVTTLKGLMTGADKDSVRFAATAYVLDQRLGLKKPKVNINILTVGDVNERLAMARSKRLELQSKPIEVTSELVAA